MKQPFYNNKILWRFSLICFLALIVISCRSKKMPTDIADTSLSTRQLIIKHNKAEPDFNTLATRVQINYDDGKSKQRLNANIRMKKDEVIWVTASVLGITVAKALLTPDSVSVYESISKRYFEGDYQLISDWLGVNLNFKQAQALLLGQAVIELKPNAMQERISDNKYVLEPKVQHNLYRQNLAFYPRNFKMASQTLEKYGQRSIFTLDYGSYQKVEGSYYPSDIHLQNIEGDKIMRLHINFRKVEVNPKLSFPYRVPSDYKQMQID